MAALKDILANNQLWAAGVVADEPEFFAESARGQAPEFLWIGCADSRVPTTRVTDLAPGQMFVHRNIANQVIHTDLNCLSVMQYAVDVLKVKHIVVCGHYGCGGVQAAMGDQQYGLIDNWLRHIKDSYARHRDELEPMVGEAQRFDRLCELNVIDQVANVCATGIVQGAWQRGQALAVHGVIYQLADGLLQDLEVSVSGPQDLSPPYRLA